MRLSIHLEKEELERLSALAERERRDPRDQAAYLIAKALEREGELTREEARNERGE